MKIYILTSFVLIAGPVDELMRVELNKNNNDNDALKLITPIFQFSYACNVSSKQLHVLRLMCVGVNNKNNIPIVINMYQKNLYPNFLLMTTEMNCKSYDAHAISVYKGTLILALVSELFTSLMHMHTHGFV